MNKKLCYIIVSCGWLGFSRWAPGTVTSLVAAGMHWLVRMIVPCDVLIGGTMVLGVLAFVSIQYVERRDAVRDPSWIVIDEWAAVWGLLCMMPHSVVWYGIATAWFRFFDILKPGFIGKLEQLPGAWGVLLDDGAAAVAAGVLSLLMIRLIDLF